MTQVRYRVGVVMMIVVLCKISNLKRARVSGDQTNPGDSGATELVVIRHQDTCEYRVVVITMTVVVCK